MITRSYRAEEVDKQLCGGEGECWCDTAQDDTNVSGISPQSRFIHLSKQERSTTAAKTK